MSSEIVQNPNVNISNIAPKMSKQVITKNKSSKRFPKNKTNNKNKDNISNNNQNKPLKVVYISNPVKFQVNADEFQALVQGLTGRDATEWTVGNNNNDNNSALDVGSSKYSRHGGVQETSSSTTTTMTMNDCQVKADDYHDGSELSEMSLDYFGSLDDYEDNKEQLIDYYQGFPSMYD